MSDDDLENFSKNKRIWKNTPYYEEWLKPLDLLHTMGGVVDNKDGVLLNFTLLRSKELGYYNTEEKCRFQRLFSHLKRALTLQRQLELLKHRASVIETSVNTLELGIITLDDQQKIVVFNDYAEELSNKQYLMTFRRQRLCFTLPTAKSIFSTALTQCITSGTTQRISVSCNLGNLFSVLICGLNDHRVTLGRLHHGATVYISPIEPESLPSSQALRNAWGLPPSQAKLAELLIYGMSIRQASKRLNITYETARYYSKAIYQHVGVNGQAELVKLALSDLSLRLPFL